MDTNQVGFGKVITEEAALLRIRSDALPATEETPPPPPAGAAVTAPAPGPIGLALSGGGIRSATFALGVLQALARERRLASFDYLSTVSGGGYIGAWLSAWVRRTSLAHVQRELGIAGGNATGPVYSQEPPEIGWLRRYSNYLSPRLGLFSADSWTLVATWLRNVFLNLIVLVAFLVTLLLLPLVMLTVVDPLLEYKGALANAAAWLGLAVLPASIAANLLHMERASDERQYWLVSTPGVLLTVLLPGSIAALMGGLWLFGTPEFSNPQWFALITKPLLLLSVAGVGWLAVVLYRRWKSRAGRSDLYGPIKELGVYALSAVAAMSVAVGLLMTAHWMYFRGGDHASATLLAIGPPAFLLTFGTAGGVFVGLVGRTYFEHSREWWSRMNAWFIGAGIVWLVWTCYAFYAAPLVSWIFGSIGTWTQGLLGAGWVGSLIATLLTPKTSGLSKRAQSSLFPILNVAAVVFIAGFALLVSAATHFSLAALAHASLPAPQATAQLSSVSVEISGDAGDATTRMHLERDARPGLPRYVEVHVAELRTLANAQGPGSLTYPVLGLACSIAVLLIFGFRVDVNKFSLHNLYKNRLIRCYLGASNSNRNEQPFTGFDEHDDCKLKALVTGDAAQPRAQRPFHIFNAALNIAQGKNLAWQERKAAAFSFTPTHIGYSLADAQGDSMETRMMLGRLVNQGYLGEDDAATSVRVDPPAAYRPTSLYATADLEEPGFTLGMAMATSGAAASPNMGPSTRPALAFVMTLFNVRIGRWCSNPAGRRWLRASPRFGLLCLLQELFGLSNENRDYVYISDGGHFDNLGIYELVRRRCSVIWVVDATADLERGFADLGRSIRQCRIDFGVEITLSLDELKAKRANRSPNAAYAEGTVDYGPGSSRGKIIYIKPTLCAAGDEPVDVLAFATRNPTFPHQSTADQFYSESQFESYRRLGLHIAGKCLSLHQATLPIAIPSGEVIPPEPVPLRTPHPVWQWFVGALLLSLVFVVGLGGYRHAQMPCVPSGSGLDSLQIALATQRAAVLNQYADRAEKLIRRAEERNPACLAHANPDSGTGWVAAIFKTLRLEPPSVPQIWLWLDNLFVAVYVVTLILGFQSVRSWAPSSLRRRWSGLALLLTLTLPVVAGIADYVENFLLLDGLTRIQDIAKIVPNIALASVTKFIFFYTSIGILLLSAAASWIARRLSNE